MMHMRALAAVLLPVLVSGCARRRAANETVTIGFTGPLSGGAALYGRNVLDGLEMAIADINDGGGIK